MLAFHLAGERNTLVYATANHEPATYTILKGSTAAAGR